MKGSSKTRRPLLPEMEELKTRLDIAQQLIKAADERLAASEKSLKELRMSETLLVNVSARFVNLPADRIDSEIEDAQRRLCEHLDLDRATLWQIAEGEPETLLLTHYHQLPENPLPALKMIANDYFPWSSRKVLGGETLVISKMADLPPDADQDRETYRKYGTKSTVLVPLSVGEGPVFGLLTFAVTHKERDWTATVVTKFKLIAQVFANALARKQSDIERKRMEDQLLERLLEIEALKHRLESENIYLREEIRHLVEHAEIVGQSVAMKKVLSKVELVAWTDSTALLLGETGTGKELLARDIHRLSLRKDRPLITVNCAALPPSLIESELFGRERSLSRKMSLFCNIKKLKIHSSFSRSAL